MLEEDVKTTAMVLFDRGSSIPEIAKGIGENYHHVYSFLRGIYKNFDEVMEKNHNNLIKRKRKRYENFGILIKAKLEKLGKDQSWLSEQIGVSRQILSQYVYGKCVPMKGPAKKLCDALNLDYEGVQETLNIKFITRHYN